MGQSLAVVVAYLTICQTLILEMDKLEYTVLCTDAWKLLRWNIMNNLSHNSNGHPILYRIKNQKGHNTLCLFKKYFKRKLIFAMLIWDRYQYFPSEDCHRTALETLNFTNNNACSELIWILELTFFKSFYTVILKEKRVIT